MDLEDRKLLARSVFDSLEGVHYMAVRMLARGLMMSGGHDGPLHGLGIAFDYFADHLENKGEPGWGEENWLAELKLSHEIHQLAWYYRGRDELLEQLEPVEEPPWPALRDAIQHERNEALSGEIERANDDPGPPFAFVDLRGTN